MLAGDHSEDARAFLQSRVAVFWKVWFLLGLFSGVLGSLGALTDLGAHLLFDYAGTAQAGLFWLLCARGTRSRWFSRVMETVGLLIQMTLGAIMMRLMLPRVALDHPVATVEGAIMTDGYVTMMLMGGTSLMVVIRAALIPSSPRRTIIVSFAVGIPVILVSLLLVPTLEGGLGWRGLDSPAVSTLGLSTSLYWLFVIITCAFISHEIYGLRAEVRQARQLGQYVLEKKLGEGGMGEVYRARHGMMRRPSAIKLLKADAEASILRFEREVQLTARLTHPNTITIYDFGRTHDGVFYYAMELLDGANLSHIVEHDGPQPAGRVVAVLSMACGALAEAHAIGLIHRDIKPSNIMLCSQGGEVDVVKVLDFGLVKELDVDQDVELTGTNSITGSPQYMAPESILSPDSVDARTDIYALGAVAYYMLAGTAVFDGKSVVEVCGQHVHEQPKPLSELDLDVPADLEKIVLRCLSKKPEERPSSALELRRLLAACQVEPWDSTDARNWWRDNSPESAGTIEPSAGTAKTVAVHADRSVG